MRIGLLLSLAMPFVVAAGFVMFGFSARYPDLGPLSLAALWWTGTTCVLAGFLWLAYVLCMPELPENPTPWDRLRHHLFVKYL